jgi:hypothetical protein
MDYDKSLWAEVTGGNWITIGEDKEGSRTSFHGKLVQMRHNQNGLYAEAVDIESGEVVNIGGGVMLQHALENLKEGEEFMVQYKGKKNNEKGTREYNDFTVLHKRSDT